MPIISHFIMAYADRFDVFGPYTKSSGRKIVIVINKKTKARRTVSYPKWIMECHLGKKLDKDKHTVDHWDSDFDNNEISNLRLVDRKTHSADDTRRVKLVKFKCKMCDKEFERSPRLIRDKSKKGNAGPFCSKSCAGKYSRKIQLNQIDKMDAQDYIESEYYKRKYVKASAEETNFDVMSYSQYIFEKYAAEDGFEAVPNSVVRPIFRDNDYAKAKLAEVKKIVKSIMPYHLTANIDVLEKSADYCSISIDFEYDNLNIAEKLANRLYSKIQDHLKSDNVNLISAKDIDGFYILNINIEKL